MKLIFFLYLGILIFFQYVNGTYTPSKYVKEAHSVPHLNSQLKKTSSTFSITDPVTREYSSSIASPYITSAAAIPIILTSVNLFMVVVFLLFLIIRNYLRKRGNKGFFISGRFEKGISNSAPAAPPQTNQFKSPYCSRPVHIFVLSLILVLLMDNLLFVGNTQVSTSTNNAAEQVNNLVNTCHSVTDYGSQTYDRGQLMLSTLNSIECGFLSSESKTSLTNSISTFTNGAAYVNSYLSDIPDLLTSGQSNVNSKLSTKDTVVFIFYGFIVLFVALYGLVYASRSKVALSTIIFITTLLVSALLVVVGFGFTFTILLGDFCMDPGQNLAGATPNINLSNLTSYYSSCQGYNPVLTTLSTSTTAAQTTSTILSNITGTTTDSCTTSLSSELKPVFSTLGNMTALASCNHVYPYYSSIIEYNMCDNGIIGVGSIVITEFLTVFFLYIALFASSYFYDLFDIDPDMKKLGVRRAPNRTVALNIQMNGPARPAGPRDLIGRVSQTIRGADDDDDEYYEGEDDYYDEGEEVGEPEEKVDDYQPLNAGGAARRPLEPLPEEADEL